MMRLTQIAQKDINMKRTVSRYVEDYSNTRGWYHTDVEWGGGLPPVLRTVYNDDHEYVDILTVAEFEEYCDDQWSEFKGLKEEVYKYDKLTTK